MLSSVAAEHHRRNTTPHFLRFGQIAEDNTATSTRTAENLSGVAITYIHKHSRQVSPRSLHYMLKSANKPRIIIVVTLWILCWWGLDMTNESDVLESLVVGTWLALRLLPRFGFRFPRSAASMRHDTILSNHKIAPGRLNLQYLSMLGSRCGNKQVREEMSRFGLWLAFAQSSFRDGQKNLQVSSRTIPVTIRVRHTTLTFRDIPVSKQSIWMPMMAVWRSKSIGKEISLFPRWVRHRSG